MWFIEKACELGDIVFFGKAIGIATTKNDTYLT